MARSKIQTNSVADSFAWGMRNRIINGGFDIWQRGTSHTYNNGESGYHTADRWFSAAFVSGGTLALSQQTANNVGVDSEFFLRATTTGSVAAGSATIYSEQKIENLKQFNNKNITLSFYIKANTNLSFQLRRHYYYGSGGSSEEYTSFSDVAVTTSWTRHTITFPAQDFSAKTFGSSNYLGIMFYWSTGQGTGQLNDASIDIANVQLEEGTVATPFEHRPYGQELALCQRYFYVFPPRNGGALLWTTGFYSSFVYAVALIPRSMRALPTPTDATSGSSTVSSGAGNVYSSNGTNTNANTSSGSQPVLSTTGTPDSPVLIMKWSGASTPTTLSNNFASTSFNGGLPGILLNSEL